MEQIQGLAAVMDAPTNSRIAVTAEGTGQRAITKHAVIRDVPTMRRHEEFVGGMVPTKYN